MTNPSAKYDAAGNAGVINIKTKKNLAQGFNGNISFNYGQGVYAKANSSVMLNYRNSKVNTFLNYGYTLNNNFMNFDIQRNFFGSNGVQLSALDQQSGRVNHNQNQTLKLGVDYFASDKTTLGITDYYQLH
jgi:outer membrane receptor protein involved in Fe transport